MATEKRTTQTDPQGNTHTTTVIREGNSESGGGAAKWVFLVVLVIAIATGAYLFTQTNAAEIAKDNAVADAAEQVGDAAGQVGDAAQEAGEAISDAASGGSE
ncbi:MAG: hypothetical protein SXU28_10960 [Pseudomonadota bacterium]|nr:hypothetical protein [Pseudomonadota bacterium]